MFFTVAGRGGGTPPTNMQVGEVGPLFKIKWWGGRGYHPPHNRVNRQVSGGIKPVLTGKSPARDNFYAQGNEGPYVFYWLRGPTPNLHHAG